jgi:hypothetical protein
MGVSDREGILPWPDERIWVRLKPEWTPDPELRWSIERSAHTHRGHLHVSARDGSLLATVHPGDITEASPEAWLWIDGFLRGQEAGLFEFLGRSIDLLDNHDDGDIARWLDWNQRFRRHGWAPPLWPVPAADPVLNELSDPQPWAYSGGRFWVWHDGAWVVADQQPPDADPDVPGRFWPGTRCVQRGHHLLASFGAISACEDCHLVS